MVDLSTGRVVIKSRGGLMDLKTTQLMSNHAQSESHVRSCQEAFIPSLEKWSNTFQRNVLKYIAFIGDRFCLPLNAEITEKR